MRSDTKSRKRAREFSDFFLRCRFDRLTMRRQVETQTLAGRMQIDPAQDHRQLRRADFDARLFIVGIGDLETTLLKLVEEKLTLVHM